MRPLNEHLYKNKKSVLLGEKREKVKFKRNYSLFLSDSLSLLFKTKFKQTVPSNKKFIRLVWHIIITIALKECRKLRVD